VTNALSAVIATAHSTYMTNIHIRVNVDIAKICACVCIDIE
jgi:hypothetical protein